jgi:adenine deaminase
MSDECRYCGKKGHWAHECQKKKRDEEAHVMQATEEDESTLFMASATIVDLFSVQSYRKAVQLDESRLFIQLAENGGGNGGH